MLKSELSVLLKLLLTRSIIDVRSLPHREVWSFFCKKFLTEFLLTEPDVQLVPSSASLLDPFEQLEDRQTESIGDDLDRIQRRVSLSVLDTAEIRLIKPAPFAKLDLAHPSGETELAHAGAESLCQGIFHTPNYVVYAINRINTNSYK